jgi:cell division septation protein DedD
MGHGHGRLFEGGLVAVALGVLLLPPLLERGASKIQL